MKTILYNKVYKTAFACFLILAPTFLSSCDDWLDVKPKSEIEGSEMFSTQDGFKDVLGGVYAAMSETSLYGREMTYGLLDVFGSCYYGTGTNGVYAYAASNDYQNSLVENAINNIWHRAYYAIATTNELLSRLEQADKGMFAKDNYNVIKGEAIGLRAFLHFDMLRLFAPSFTVDPDAAAIPYVTTYSFNVTPTSTVRETCEKVLADLQTAADLLKTSDPIATGREITAIDDDGYLKNRQFHMNYYAVIATMARVCLYMQDYSRTRQYANEVINSGKFPWTKVENIATTTDGNRDRTFTSEQVFALQIDDLEDYVYWVIAGSNRVILNVYSYWITNVFPASTHATDWRYMYFFTNKEISSSSYYYGSSKLWQEGMNEDYTKRMPLIRLPELYLMLAECDVTNAASQLNIIREHRGVTSPVTAATETALQDEITKEYFREYYNEGQMFHRYKRLNANQRFGSYNFSKVSFNTDKYVLPIPNEEIEFGNRKTIDN